MITRMRLENFRSHKDSEFTLEPLTVFIGPVASGKSSIFKALELLRGTVSCDLSDLFKYRETGFRQLLSLDASSESVIGIEVDVIGLPGFESDRIRYRIEIAENEKGLYYADEKLERNGSPVFPPEKGILSTAPTDLSWLRGVWKNIGVQMSLNDERYRLSRILASSLYEIKYYHLASSLRHPIIVREERESDSRPDVENINRFGEWIGEALRSLKNSNATLPLFNRIISEMHKLFGDQFRGIRLEDSDWSFAIEKKGSALQRPEQLSDGELQALALLCIIYQPFQRDVALAPRTLCIEEPENGIHPRWLFWLFDRLATLAYPAGEQPAVQVLVSSHSPHLIGFVEEHPPILRIVENVTGHSHVRELTENELDSELSLRDLWLMDLLKGA